MARSVCSQARGAKWLGCRPRPSSTSSGSLRGTDVAAFYRWWIVDEVTGVRVLTPYKLTRAHAKLTFPDAEPDLKSREVRDLPDLGPDLGHDPARRTLDRLGPANRSPQKL